MSAIGALTLLSACSVARIVALRPLSPCEGAQVWPPTACAVLAAYRLSAGICFAWSSSLPSQLRVYACPLSLADRHHLPAVGLCARLIAVGGPVIHEPATLLEQVAAPICLLDFAR